MKVSLGQQIEAVQMAVNRQRKIAQGQKVGIETTKSQEEYQVDRLKSVALTLIWFQENEAQIRAFMKLPAASRLEAIHFAQRIMEANNGTAGGELREGGEGSLPNTGMGD